MQHTGFVVGTSVTKVNKVKRIFLNSYNLGLREGNTMLCIILRNPRSEVSRLQMISVLMCLFMASMLRSIMFYSTQFDDHEYSVQWLRNIYISIQSSVLNILITSLVLLAFKRSSTYNYTNSYDEFSRRPTFILRL